MVLSQDGTQTSWQVPDFSIDLEHGDRRSVLIGQANIASAKGDWQLEFRTAQQTRRKSLAITALIQNLVPSGIAGNFSSLGVLKALDMVVNGEATIELSNSGEFLSGGANFDLEGGQITPPWDPDSPLRIDKGNLAIRYLKEKRRGRDRAIDPQLGGEQGDLQRRVPPGARRQRRAHFVGLHRQGRRCGARRRGAWARADEDR